LASKKPPKKTQAPKEGLRREIVDQRLVKALSHPVRANALAILNERVASPNEIAKELGHPVGHVSYHVNILSKCDCIELVDTAQRRGAVEHYYRATSRVFISDEDWQRLPASIRPGLSTSLLKELVQDAGQAIASGTFDARTRHLSWTPMIVDERGWEEVNDRLAKALEDIFEIQAASAGRLAGKKEESIPISVTLMGYETPPKGQPKGKKPKA